MVGEGDDKKFVQKGGVVISFVIDCFFVFLNLWKMFNFSFVFVI